MADCWSKEPRDVLNGDAAEQGDEADEAKRIGASQLIPGVRRLAMGSA